MLFMMWIFPQKFQEFRESFKSLGELALIGILLIYLILSTQFKSWIQPLVIMVAVPFSIIGAICALVISGIEAEVMNTGKLLWSPAKYACVLFY